VTVLSAALDTLRSNRLYKRRKPVFYQARYSGMDACGLTTG
jgi:hypothetical protein